MKIITIQHYDDGWYQKEHPVHDNNDYYYDDATRDWIYIRESERHLIEDRPDIKSVFELKCHWSLKTLEAWCKESAI